MRVKGGKLQIDREGKINKFVDAVDQVSFSGSRAQSQKQDVIYVTERCVIKLTERGLVITEIAPGIDLQSDILDQAATELVVSDDCKIMDSNLFDPACMGLELMDRSRKAPCYGTYNDIPGRDGVQLHTQQSA